MFMFHRVIRFGPVTIENCKMGISSGFRSNSITFPVRFYAKSPEETLGIDKPKRPLTPFFKFMVQLRPALMDKNPGITTQEATKLITQHWKQLEPEAKGKLKKEYEKDMEDYRKIKTVYESSLTDDQKEEIKKIKLEIIKAKEKRKMKAELADLGKPKRPMSSYFIFSQYYRDLLKGKVTDMKEFNEKVKTEWKNLSWAERAKYDRQAQAQMEKYLKELTAWEEKMIAQGRSDLVVVRRKPSAKGIENKAQPVPDKKTSKK